MKKIIQPKKNITTIILNNGSSYKKEWLNFKHSLKLETDTLKHFLWNKKQFSKKK